MGCAVISHKPLYLFDQNKCKWFRWNDETFAIHKWIEIESPPLITVPFAGIGIKEVNDSGKCAIGSIVHRSFCKQ